MSTTLPDAVAPSTAFTLARNAAGRLVLTTANGQQHVGVVPVRAFPLAAPRTAISLVSTEGHEVACIARLDDLPAATQALIEEALAPREFMPEIRRLKQVSSFATPSTWEVDTDRGPTQLLLKGEEDIRRLGRTELLILDGRGVLFRIRDLTTLDRGSRRLLDRFL